MLDLHIAFDLNTQYDERRRQLAYDYQKGNADFRAVLAFVRRNWQRVQNAANNLRRGLGSLPQNPELHY